MSEPWNMPFDAEKFHSQLQQSVDEVIRAMDEIHLNIRTRTYLRELLKHLDSEPQGALSILKNSAGEYVVAYEWGEEADDSSMAEAASYATADTLVKALEQVVSEVLPELLPKH